MIPDKGLLRVVDANGNDVTDQMNIKWDDANSTVIFSAKDPVSFFNKYKGSKLTIDFPANVMGAGDQDITNQAIQNTFGNENKTNVVTNHQSKMDPKKDVVVNAGSKDSLNGKDISVGQDFDYKISAGRPGNCSGTTSEWSIIDTIPKQDQVTGQWQVYATSDITLADGTVIKKGTYISKYFTFNMNDGKVIISANKEVLDLINSDINKKNPIRWDAYFQVKRIAGGKDITNIAQESYNHQIVKTNKVSTTTPEPAKPQKQESKEAPKQSVKEIVQNVVNKNEPKQPDTKETVQNVIKNMSQPKNDKLPQTSQKENENLESIGIMSLIASILGMLGLLGSRKIRKNIKYLKIRCKMK